MCVLRLYLGWLLLSGLRSVAAEPPAAPVWIRLQAPLASEGRTNWTSLTLPSTPAPTPSRALTSTEASVSPRLLHPGQVWAQAVPLFVVEREGGPAELRRLPAKGRENQAEPVGWLLPALDDPSAPTVAGRWQVTADRVGGSKAWFDWELAAVDGRVAGRFDQDTDYRFAFLTGGTLRTNRLELAAEYVQDRFQLEGVWDGQEWKGRWRREDDGESGAWRAIRREPGRSVPDLEGARLLWEWRRTNGVPAVSYQWDGDSPGDGWQRSGRPLGRAWP
jgi:hypothetical protein